MLTSLEMTPRVEGLILWYWISPSVNFFPMFIWSNEWTASCCPCKLGAHCHGMTSLFPFSSLSVPRPISITFRLHPTSSACLPPPLLQLRGVLMQLCYIRAQTSLRLMSDLLGPDPCTKGYHLYTSYNLSDPFFIINNG